MRGSQSVQRLANSSSALAVPVLMYHSISRHASERFRPYAVDPDVFIDHMSALRDAGYAVITVAEYVRMMDEPHPRWPSHPAVLTFDDAFSDFHTRALPVLQVHGFPATLYVPAGYVGGTSRWLAREDEADRPVMSWEALREAVGAGVEIGSHSQTHPQLDLLPTIDVSREITDSKMVLEDQLQLPVGSFAYPFGYWNRSVRAAVVDAGYSSACAVRDLTSTTVEDRHTISRWMVPFGMDAAALLRTLATRSGRVAELRSDARAGASRLLRRAGVKKRGLPSSPTS
jgi:peptidoglycan/xylan/chitin deacetylase (PgdA/CDA1 family)